LITSKDITHKYGLDSFVGLTKTIIQLEHLLLD